MHRSLELASNSMPGYPPIQFLIKVATDILSSSPDIKGRMDQHQKSADGITFQPMSNLVGQRDKIIQNLAEGKRLALDVRWLTEILGDEYPKPVDAMEFVRETLGDRVVFLSYTAVSVECIDRIVASKVQDLREVGFADTLVSGNAVDVGSSRSPADPLLFA